MSRRRRTGKRRPQPARLPTPPPAAGLPAVLELPHRTPQNPTDTTPTEAAPAVYPRPVTPAETGADRDDTTLTAELAEALRKIPTCGHCGGRHTRACPRVKTMTWHVNGTLASVTFWPAGKWDDSGVIWPEDLEAADTE